jgi:hypothetical protein
MKLGTKHWRSGLVMVGAVVALLGLTIAFAANPPPQSQQNGQTYGKLSNAWWQWALSIPTSTNPLLDTTGADCGQGQSGSVWFLAGTFGGSATPITRSCTIPAGKTLFFPTINFFQNNAGVKGSNCPPTHSSIPQLWGALDQNVAAVTTHEATVDGVPQQDQRAGPNNPPYNVMIPSDNLFTFLTKGICTLPFPAGTYSPNVSDGFYVLLTPLSPGPHTIHFSAATPQGTQQDVTYNLTVQ